MVTRSITTLSGRIATPDGLICHTGTRREAMWPAIYNPRRDYFRSGTVIKSAVAHTSNFMTYEWCLLEWSRPKHSSSILSIQDETEVQCSSLHVHVIATASNRGDFFIFMFSSHDCNTSSSKQGYLRFLKTLKHSRFHVLEPCGQQMQVPAEISHCCFNWLGITRLPIGTYRSLDIRWYARCFQRQKLYWILKSLSSSNSFQAVRLVAGQIFTAGPDVVHHWSKPTQVLALWRSI